MCASASVCVCVWRMVSVDLSRLFSYLFSLAAARPYRDYSKCN